MGKTRNRRTRKMNGGGIWDRLKSEVKSIFTLGSPSAKDVILTGSPASASVSPPPPPPPPANMANMNSLVSRPPSETSLPSLPRSVNSAGSFKTAFSNNMNMNEYNLANVPISNNNTRRRSNRSIPNNWEEINLNNNTGREFNPFNRAYRAPNRTSANRLRAPTKGGSRRSRKSRSRGSSRSRSRS